MKKTIKIMLFLLLVFLVVSFNSFASSKNQLQPPAQPDPSFFLRADQKAALLREKNGNSLERQARNSNAASNSEVVRRRIPDQTRTITGLKLAHFRDPGLKRNVSVKADEALVRFRKDATELERKSSLARLKAGYVVRKTKGLEKIRYQRIRVPSGIKIEDFLADLRKDPAVLVAEPNVLLEAYSTPTNDQLFSQQWGLKSIRAPEAWEITQGDPSVIIAVIDSGIDLDHPDISDNLVPGYNFVGDNDNADDDFGHGTQVSGIIAAVRNNDIGIAGVAPLCRVMPIKVLDANGEGTSADVAEAIIYAVDTGCRVINLSLGTYAGSEALREAVDYASDRNCVLVAAAGNDGSTEPCYPAAYTNTIAVSALTHSGNGYGISNRSDYIDVSAIGKDSRSTAHDGQYGYISGTSASSAYVSGLAALIATFRPELANESIEALIRTTAQDIGKVGWDDETGMGKIDCYAALTEEDPPLVDVGIIDFTFLPVNPLPSQQVNLTVTVRNHGKSPVESCMVKLLHDGSGIAKAEIPRLGPKQKNKVHFTWTAPANGSPEATAITASIASLENEDRLDDNSHEISVLTSPEDIHDVSISDVSVSGLSASYGEMLSISATVTNSGNSDEFDIPVKMYFEDTFVSSQTLSTLPAGSQVQVLFPWNVPDKESAPHDPNLGFMLNVLADGPSNDEIEDNNNKFLRLKFTNGSTQHVFPLHAVDGGEEVHQWIAYQAYQFFTSQVEGSSLPDYMAMPGFSLDPANWPSLTAATHSYEGDNNVLQGSRDEDYIGTMPYNNHFVEGADGDELLTGLSLGDTSAYIRANNHRIDYWTGNNSSSYFALGRFVHLLGDMTVPAHTHLDIHIPFFDPEPYEYTMADWYSDYDFFYGDSYGDWSQIIALPTTTEALFRATADYTEDYDSEDERGDWDGPAGQPFLNSKYADELFYPTTDHNPESVDRSGGITTAECWITAEDLMPFAIIKTAQAYRYFYNQIDSTPPTVTMTYPDSGDINNPTVRTSLNSFNLAAFAVDSESGILKNGFQYYWEHLDGSTWSGLNEVSPSPAGNSVIFDPANAAGEGLYAFYVIGENGGGLQSLSAYKYIDISPKSDGDAIPDEDDNCPDICNSEQLDADSDGLGDVCDDTPGCGGCGQPICENPCGGCGS